MAGSSQHGRPSDEAELYRLLAENVLDYAVFVIDRDRRVRTWNPGAERLLGYTEQEILGEFADRFFTDEDIAARQPQKEIEQALTTDRGDDDRWHVKKDGTRFWSSGVLTPLRRDDGTIRGFAKLMRDRTALKIAESVSSEERAYSESVIATVREPLVVLDADLRVRSANRSFYRTFKVASDETQGRLIYELGNRQWDIPELRRLLQEILPQNSAFEDFEVEHEFESIGWRAMVLNARKVYRPGNHSELILVAIEDVTARRQAENERKELEKRFTSLVRNIRDHAIFTLSPEGTVTSWNIEAERILGYSESEAIGLAFPAIFTPEDIESGKPEWELQTAMEQGRAEDERWHVRKNGERFWALGIVTPMYDSQGRFRGYSKILRDMTDRKRTEDRCRFQSHLLDAVGQAVIATDPDGKVRYWNTAAESLYGWTAEEAEGRNVGNLVVAPEGESLAAEIMTRLASGETWSGEFDVRRKDGTMFPAFVTDAPIIGDDGRIEAIVGVSADLTERNRADAAKRESEGRLRTLTDNLPDGAIYQVVQDADGRNRFTFASAGFEQLFGVTPEAAVADPMNLYGTIHEADRERVLSEEAEAQRRLKRFDCEFRHRLPDGEVRWVHARSAPRRLPDGNIVWEGVLTDATHRKRVESALRESEDRYRALFESIDEGFCIIEVLFDDAESAEDYRFLTVNPAFERQTGLKEAAGKRMKELVPQHEEHWFEIYGRVATTGESVRFTNEAKALDGRWFDVNAFRVGGPESRQVAVLFTDISERKQAEKALRDSERRSRLILESITDAFYALDRDWRFTYLNGRAEELLGRTRDGLLGKDIWAEFAPAIGTKFEQSYRRAMHEGITIAFEAYYDPHERWYEVYAYPSPDGIAVYFRDANERRQAAEERERLLAEAEAERNRLKAVIENVPVAVILAEAPSGKMVLGNPQINRMFRHPFRPSPDVPSYAEWLGYHPDGRKVEGHEWPLARALSGEVAEGEEYIYERGDGTRFWIRASAAPIPDGRGGIAGAVVAIDDIDALKQAEEALRDADRRKDEFLAMLAHELRNPLAPIRSGLDLLKLQGGESEVVEVMGEQVGHVVRLVDDLLDVSRILRGKVELRKEPTDLGAVLRRAVETVRPRIEEHRQQLIVSRLEHPVRLDADPVRLTQIITNLLHNASKYTDDGGEVRLEASIDGSEAVILVSDTGIGIVPELLPKVFDLFTQADQALARSQGGLGIGLTVVRSLVEMHGGSVTAASEGAGRGSSFTVRLPITEPAETALADGSHSAPAGALRILVVDDNAPGARLLSILLVKLGGHEIEVVYDGDAALAAADRFKPDLIFLDIGLPKIDGFEVARRLRQRPRFRETLLVALTGYGTSEDRRRSIEAGFDDHLVKPPGVEILRTVLAHPKLIGR